MIDTARIMSQNGNIMSTAMFDTHQVTVRRKARGWSQEDLAEKSGIPRSSVSAIEASRLTPSVTAALAVASALECSVEELFGSGEKHSRSTMQWAWEPHGEVLRYWEAEVGGRRWLFPVERLPGNALSHDGVSREGVLHERSAGPPSQTLVLAGCDPAAGLLATEYAKETGFRLLGFSRGGASALELLKQGVVHVAALHRSTADQPNRNADTVRERLGNGYQLLRSADWQEGIALPASDPTISVSACARKINHWAMREPGSAARECLDELLSKPRTTKRVLTSHTAVAEMVRSGWAEAGVCVQLSAEDAGLRFLPVRTESLDFCFPSSMQHDPRVLGLIRLLRSRAHRRFIDELPGYDARHTGELTTV